jgi:hypothetical protein
MWIFPAGCSMLRRGFRISQPISLALWLLGTPDDADRIMADHRLLRRRSNGTIQVLGKRDVDGHAGFDTRRNRCGQ